MSSEQIRRPRTIAVHAGGAVDRETKAVAPPIHLATTFERGPDGSYPGGHVYGRSSNPTRERLEGALAAMEGAAGALAFASGLAASHALAQTVKPGGRVVIPSELYYGTGVMMRELLPPVGVEVASADMTDPDALRSVVAAGCDLLWLESPSNPTLRITDLAASAAIGREAGAVVACDNTWATPVFQRPLDLGCDVSVYSTTKYHGGHSDVTGGALVVRDEGPLLDRLRVIQNLGGAVPSPFDCWLVLRGMRTLHVRMEAQAASAEQIAGALRGHAGIERVHYPGWGAMLSFEVAGGAEAALAVANGCELFIQATSLGGYESLIEHRASVEGDVTTAPAGLLRVSVGLEDPADLIEDLSRSLRKAIG